MLRVLKPLVRLLLRNGVAYPAFASAMKTVFLEAARDEIKRAGQKQTDSAVSLLSGLHRRDVRTLGAEAPAARTDEEPLNLATQVVGLWLSNPDYLDEEGMPHALPRFGEAPSFDSLVALVSRDIRARAVLAELERLGIAQSTDGIVQLLTPGLVPRAGFPETMALLRDNLHDHVAAATLNAEGERNYLEQAVFVDQLTEDSVRHLHLASARAWRQAFKTVMQEAQVRFAHDEAHAPAGQRVHRARFGSYFYAAKDDDQPS